MYHTPQKKKTTPFRTSERRRTSRTSTDRFFPSRVDSELFNIMESGTDSVETAQFSMDEDSRLNSSLVERER